VLDGIELEVRGTPAAVICTEPFVATGRAMAKARGKADYRFALIPHPIGSATDEEMARRVDAALPQVLELLTGRDGA
jgi:hypothetical protein